MVVARLLALGVAALAGAGLGCGPRYSTISSHTLAAGEHQDKDVVWVTGESGVLMRCENQPSGPVCVQARTP